MFYGNLELPGLNKIHTIIQESKKIIATILYKLCTVLKNEKKDMENNSNNRTLFQASIYNI